MASASDLHELGSNTLLPAVADEANTEISPSTALLANSMSTASSNGGLAHCYLLSIAPELRNRIWEFYFGDILDGEDGCDITSLSLIRYLLPTCQQIKDEAGSMAKVFCQCASFEVIGPSDDTPDYDYSFLDNLDDRDLKHVNRLSIESTAHDGIFYFLLGVWACHGCDGPVVDDGEGLTGRSMDNHDGGTGKCPKQAMMLANPASVDMTQLEQITAYRPLKLERRFGSVFVELSDRTGYALEGQSRKEIKRIKNIKNITGWGGLTKAELRAALEWFEVEASAA